MSNDNNRELLEEYKEIGLNFRLYVTELTSTTRLMVPAMVIGLLILYGGIKEFAGVPIANPVGFHQSLWCGCVVISLLWVVNVSRLTQLLNKNTAMLREADETYPALKLKASLDITKMDCISRAPTILRHRYLRLIGFWVYLSLLVNTLFSDSELKVSSNLIEGIGPWIVVGLSGFLAFGIGWLYNFGLPPSPKKIIDRLKCVNWSVRVMVNMLACLIVIVVIAILLVLACQWLQIQPEATIEI